MSAWPDRAIAELAEVQQAQVTRTQLLRLGVGRGAIHHSIKRGRIYPTFHGVYAVGHMALPPLAREMGAVLACGERAFLSHSSAAALWGIRPPSDGDVEVTVVGRCAGRSKGIHMHRVTNVHPTDVRRHQNIPVASPARCLLEIAPSLADRALERAFDEVVVRRLATLREVRDLLARHPRRPGSARLAALADAARSTTMTRSQAEERMLALVRRGGLPEPEVNAKLGRYEVDFLWRDERVVVEVDGYAFHGSRAAFERDRHRDAALQAAGYAVIRVTWRQLVHEPEAVLVRIATVLARRAA